MRIEDYALIGDLQTAALVGRDGSVDWLCLPRFDSASVFAALLGDERHGRWSTRPGGSCRPDTTVSPGTLILETDFETPEGAVRVIDFMPHRDDGAPQLIRIVEGLDGACRWRCALAAARLRRDRAVDGACSGRIVAVAGPGFLSAQHAAPAASEDAIVTSEFMAIEGSANASC